MGGWSRGLTDQFDEQCEGDRTDQHGDPEITNKSEGQCRDREHRERCDPRYGVHSRWCRRFPVQRKRRPRTMTTEAPTMANPITARPSPTGLVSVTVTGGACLLPSSSLQELKARKSPATGNSRSFFKRCLARRRDDRWCLLEWIMGYELGLCGGNQEARNSSGHRC